MRMGWAARLCSALGFDLLGEKQPLVFAIGQRVIDGLQFEAEFADFLR